MRTTEMFSILGIEETREEKTIKEAYREKLVMTNPEDDPEGFKRLRQAYEEALAWSRQSETRQEEDTTESGQWVAKVAKLYSTLHGRQDLESWSELFAQDIYLSLEGEEECQQKLLVFLMQHYRLPSQIWKLLEEKLEIYKNQTRLKEQFPAEFIEYLLSRTTRSDNVDFSQFDGPEDGDYDAFLQCYDDCWRALQEQKLDTVAQLLEESGRMGITHPCMEVCRAHYNQAVGRPEEALDGLRAQQARFPGDELVEYNLAQLLWDQGQTEEAARRFEGIKERNDKHYTANMRLAKWYHDQGDDHRAKKCAEEVLALGYDDGFHQLLKEINAGLEEELEKRIELKSDPNDILDLGWCYLQDEKFSVGIRRVREIEDRVPEGRMEEYLGLMAKLHREAAEYEVCVDYARRWREALEKRIPSQEGENRAKDEDRLRQSHAICMQCYQALGYLDKSCYELALQEADALEAVNPHDIGVLMERARVYIEMEEYDKCVDLVKRLVEEYRIYAALAIALEAYRRQWDARNVVQTARQLIQFFPDYVKPYVDMAKVYLDLQYKKELEELLAEAAEKEIKSPYLEAYAYQKEHAADTEQINAKVEQFRQQFLEHVENGELSFYEQGLERITEYLYDSPGAYLLVERGIFHKAAHHYQEAIEDFEQVLVYQPCQIYALNGLAHVYRHQEEYEQAIVCLRRAILYDTEKDLQPGAYMDMAELYSRLADYEKSLEYLEQYVKCAEEVKHITVSAYRMGKVANGYIRAGRLAEARTVLETTFAKAPLELYDRLVDMYQVTGRQKEARQVLEQWRRHLGIDENFVERWLRRAKRSRQYVDYYSSKGWSELLFGDRGKAVKAFVDAMSFHPDLDSDEDLLCDAVFVFILCGEDRLGKKYGVKLRDWLRRERLSAGNAYYEREKSHLHMEFLAAYYEESIEKLQELLERESKCECCSFCSYAVCKELEGVRILLMLRAGQTKEARERLEHNLNIQPQDEYMLAIRHIRFGV
ncbi:MAG: tetratricopeptide repeat protein [bacterium]|nr:tetratricopeptide repeat protein [bacterium]MCM1374247.1 tetratricopeptide repeat protein [Muribaculum sp.]